MHAYIDTYIHACMHTYIHIYIHTCIYTYVRTYNIYIRSYIHTHTHIVIQFTKAWSRHIYILEIKCIGIACKIIIISFF